MLCVENMAIDIIIIVCLILLNGIFAMSEIAIISARKHQLEKLGKEGSKGAKTALKLAADPDMFLSTIQIGITLIGILTGIYSGEALGSVLGDWFVSVGVREGIATLMAKIIIVASVTYFTLIFGELVPKRVGMAASDKVARVMSRPVYWLSVAAKPFVWMLAKSTSIVVMCLGLKYDTNKVTEEEIKSMIQEGTEHGEVQKVEQDIMERVLLMGDIKVSVIMTHRADVESIDMSASKDDIHRLLSDSLHDYYPVVNIKAATVEGVISLKSLMIHLEDDDFSVEKVMTKPYAVYEDMSVYDCLEKLKIDHQSGFAIVYDEFGEYKGVITLRDIFEGLIGVVNPDIDAPQIVRRSDGEGWLIDGQCSFYDFLVYFELEDEAADTNYNTVGGLILSKLSYIPSVGERISWTGFIFEVVDMDGARIDKVLVSRLG